jgi:hypothetical protein
MVKRFPNNSKFIEIGSWKGQSAAYMVVEIINSKKDIKFICVDTWNGSIEHQSYDEISDLYNIFKNNMSPFKSYYTDLRLPSVEASKLFNDNSIDFIFIDASHEYEDVKNDIIHWLPKVKKNGILSGHDYLQMDWYSDLHFDKNGKDKFIWMDHLDNLKNYNKFAGVFGVNPAVDEFCKENNYKFEITD